MYALKCVPSLIDFITAKSHFVVKIDGLQSSRIFIHITITYSFILPLFKKTKASKEKDEKCHLRRVKTNYFLPGSIEETGKCQ